MLGRCPIFTCIPIYIIHEGKTIVSYFSERNCNKQVNKPFKYVCSDLKIKPISMLRRRCRCLIVEVINRNTNWCL